MDPLSIASSISSLVLVGGKCVIELTKWVGEVKEISQKINGFCAEITTLTDVLSSIESITQTYTKTNAFLSGPGHSQVMLWSKINQVLSDVKAELSRLDRIISRFSKAPSLFGKVKSQFKMSFEEGAIALARSRIKMLCTTLNITLQVLTM